MAAPTITTAVGANNQITITFNAALLVTAPPPSLFSVTVNGVSRAVTGVTVSGSTLVLTIASPVVDTDVVHVSYANPAQVVPPTAPGQNYSIPGGAIPVSSSAELIAELAKTTAEDIVLEGTAGSPITYDRATPFTTGAAHRLWARNQGKATLTAGLDVSKNGVQLHGITINVTSTAKAPASSCVRLNFGVANTLIEDCILTSGSGSDNGALDSGIMGYGNHGLILRRTLISNFNRWGAYLDDNNTSSANVMTELADLTIQHVYADARGSGGGMYPGTNEIGIMVGHKITNGLRRLVIRDCGWDGLEPVNNCRDTIFQDIDIDQINGSDEVGIYVERYTHNNTTDRFKIGPDVRVGITHEWDGISDGVGNQGQAAANGCFYTNGRITADLRGVYCDEGSDNVTVTDVVFAGHSERCVGWYRSFNIGPGNFTHCDWSQRDAGAARGSIGPGSKVEVITSDGLPPRRLLAAAATRDDVASFVNQDVDVGGAPPPPPPPSGGTVGPLETGILDDFDRSDATTLGAGWTADPFEINWESFSIASNDAQSTGWNSNLWAGGDYGPDCEVWAICDAKGTAVWNELMLRVTPGAAFSGYGVRWSADHVYLFRYDAGTAVQIGMWSHVVADGEGIALSAVGTSLKVWTKTGDDWAQLGSTILDSTYLDAGALVMRSDNSTTSRIAMFGGGVPGAPAGGGELGNVVLTTVWPGGTTLGETAISTLYGTSGNALKDTPLTAAWPPPA